MRQMVEDLTLQDMEGEPVSLTTEPNEHSQTEDVQHSPDSGEMSIDGDRVFQVMRQLYPVHLDHVIAEVKTQMLTERLQALEARLKS